MKRHQTLTVPPRAWEEAFVAAAGDAELGDPLARSMAKRLHDPEPRVKLKILTGEHGRLSTIFLAGLRFSH